MPLLAVLVVTPKEAAPVWVWVDEPYDGEQYAGALRRMRGWLPDEQAPLVPIEIKRGARVRGAVYLSPFASAIDAGRLLAALG